MISTGNGATLEAAGNITAGSLTLANASDASGNGGLINTDGTIAAATYNINLTGAANYTATAALTGTTLNVTLGTGSVGTLLTPVQSNFGVINVAGANNTTGAVFVADNVNNIVVGGMANGVTVGTFNLVANGTARNVTLTQANANANNFSVTNAAGNVTVTGNTFGPSNGADGSGGTLVVAAKGIVGTTGTGPVVFSANGTGTGNGGNVSVSVLDATQTVTLGNVNNGIEVSATGVNGGTAAVTAAGTLSVVTTTGTGLIASSIVNVGPTGANGNGGALSLTGGNITWTTQASTALNLVENGAGTGAGGSVSVNLTNATGAATIADAASNLPGTYSLTATGISGGGSASFNTNAGLNIYTDANGVPTGINVAPTGANASGGAIAVKAGTLNWGTSATSGTGKGTALELIADGAGTGAGGYVSVIQTGVGNLATGKGAGQVYLEAKGGNNANLTSNGVKTGSGATLEANGTLVVNPANIVITAANGLNGENLTLQSNSATTFAYASTSKKLLNGTTGVFDVSAATGGTKNGTITIINQGGGLTLGKAITAVDGVTLEVGGKGALTVTQNLGSAAVGSVLGTENVTLGSLGTGSVSDTKQITLSTDAAHLGTLNLFASVVGTVGGSIKVSKVIAPIVNANAPGGSITVTDSYAGMAKLGDITGQTAINTSSLKGITFSNVGGIDLVGNVKAGGAVILKTTAATSAIQLDASILSNGKSGAITLTDGGSGGIKATNTLVDLSATKKVTVTAAKGNVTLGTVGKALPTTGALTVTAANSIVNMGNVQTTTSVSEKATGKTGADTITVNGNIEVINPTKAGQGTILLSTAGSGTSGNNIVTKGDLGAGKTVTVTATKGSVTVKTVGVGLLSNGTTKTTTTGQTPGKVSITALDNITDNGAIPRHDNNHREDDCDHRRIRYRRLRQHRSRLRSQVHRRCRIDNRCRLQRHHQS